MERFVSVKEVTFREILKSHLEIQHLNLTSNYLFVDSIHGKLLGCLHMESTLNNRKIIHDLWNAFLKKKVDETESSPLDMTPPQDFLNIERHIIVAAFIDQLNSNHNFNYSDPLSIFGAVCEELINSNTRNDRKYLNYIYDCNIKKDVMDLTLESVINSVQQFSAINSCMDPKKANSVFADSCILLLNANTKQDRQDIYSIWNKVILQNNLSTTCLQKHEELESKTDRQTKKNKPVQGKSVKLPNSDSEIATTTNKFDTTILEFKAQLHEFPEHPCVVCTRLQYKKCLKIHTVDSSLHQIFSEINNCPLKVGDIIKICTRCKAALVKKRIPSQAYFNSMQPHPIPKELADLSKAEIQLISQVRPFMKIFNLCKGKGQAAMKGIVIHFPNSIDDVCDQLPLNVNDSDMVVVHECTEDVEVKNIITVCPRKISVALEWLKINNPLYKNIKINLERINNTEIPTIKKPDIQNPDNISDISTIHGSFEDIGQGKQILRSSINQSSRGKFSNESSGRQCTAMSMMSIAFASVQSPVTWTKDIIDQVIVKGDEYFLIKSLHRKPLMVIEAVGEVSNIFGGLDITLVIEENDTLDFFGGLNKLIDSNSNPVDHNNNPMKRLSERIEEFIVSTYQYGVITVSGYSMAIHKYHNYLYYFDSHSRGPKGYSAADGLACIIKYPINDASKQLSRLIHHNLQPQTYNDVTANNFMFTITPIKCIILNNQESIDVIEVGHEKSNLNEENKHVQSSRKGKAANFGNNVLLDCVFHKIDYNAPELEEVIPVKLNEQTLKLNRRKGKPLYPRLEARLEELSFVCQFPYGIGGLEETRKTQISTLDYFQARILSPDTRFWDNAYLFYSLARMEEQKIKQKIAVCGNMKSGPRENPSSEEQFPGLSNIHLYMSSIRGSASYWKQYAGDLIAMIKQLGIPTLFLTISSDDINSSDSLSGLLIAESFRPDSDQQELLMIKELIAKADFNSLEKVLNELTYERKTELLNNHPVQAARHFNYRIKEIIKLMVKHAKEIFGYAISDYSYRVEFQYRGSGHIHMLIWLEGITFDFNSNEGIQFIESNISCSIPDDDEELKILVLKYQNHKHTKTCYKNERSYCRFGFPHEVSEFTQILDEEEIGRNHGRFVKLRRNENETMINNYHPKLIKLLKCNMDLQLVTGAMAIAYYIAKYMSKAEPTNIREEIQKIMKEIQCDSKASYHSKAMKIAMKIMSHREVGAPEAAFRLCHLPLRKSSRSTVFIPAYLPHKRLHLFRKETLGEENVKLGLSIIEKYSYRPDSLKHICLFEFAAMFFSIKREDVNEDDDLDDDDIDETEQKSFTIVLKDNDGKTRGRMKSRTRTAIVKYPNFDVIEQKQEYFYCMILLFYPFRTETFMAPFENEAFAFQNLHTEFRKHTDNSIIRLDLLMEIDRALLRVATFAVEESQISDAEEFEANFHEEEEEEIVVADIFRPVNLVQNMQAKYDTLSSEQKEVFKETKEKLDGNGNQMLRYIAGAGGVGKSYLIDLLSSLITNLEPRDNSLIRAAPTGLAALNINATTLHKAFCLPVEKKGLGVFMKLGARKLQEMRSLLRNVNWIILDEISMISYETLRMIHLRLCEILDSEEPFAGMNLLNFGDIMQLRPVKGHWIFEQPVAFSHEVNLWKLFQFHELTKNHRQTLGGEYLKLLNNLREGIMTKEDFKLLETRIFDLDDEVDRFQYEVFSNALALYPTNNEVEEYNRIKTEELKATNVKLYNFNAQNSLENGDKCPDSLLPLTDKDTAGIVGSLEIGEGSRVMLRRNIALGDALVNGSIGTVKGFIWTALRREQLNYGDLPEAVVIEFDQGMGGQKKDERGFVLIKCVNVEFIGKKNTLIKRRMIPLVRCWALNFHKAQGTTLSHASISLGKEVFAKGMAYVALSRVKTIEGLRIIQLNQNKVMTLKPNKAPCDEKALRELNRLRLMKHIKCDEDGIDSLLEWMLEYPTCFYCRKWLCLCCCL